MRNLNMEKSQKKYSKALIDIVRDIIWAQWNRLGLNGTGGINRYSVDIESSLIAAAYGSRLDGRLYEGVWSWVKLYGSIINAERLSTIICESNDEWVVRFFGALLSNIDPVKWKGVINRCKKLCSRSWKETPLLIDSPERNWRDEDPILKNWSILYNCVAPKEKMQDSDIILRNNVLMRYRFLYGTVIRADVLYLLSISYGAHVKREIDILTSVRLAERLSCHLSTIHRIQNDLESGGFIEPASMGKKKRALITTWVVKDVNFLQSHEGFDLGMIDWIRINALFCAALDLAARLEASKNEVISKAILQEFQINFFPLLRDYGASMPATYGPSLGPLEQYSVDALFNMVHKNLQIFYRFMCGIN